MQKKLKIKKGDTVKVIAGAANGQQGVILDVDYKKERDFIEGLSIHMSNVILMHNGEPTKVGRKVADNGKLVRFAKKTGEEIN